MFGLYFRLGIEHILDLQAYDHILFIVALTVVYSLKQWKHVVILATAFTIGHSITLALASLNLIAFNVKLIEILIVVTIFITGFVNLFKVNKQYSPKIQLYKYITALIFGLVHGLGFSNYLKYLLGKESNIVEPLLAFNLGLELGQIVVISSTLLLSFILTQNLKVKHREWVLVASGATIGISIMLISERLMG